MDIEVKSYHLERVFSAIQRSYKIKKHIDLFIWLQNSVSEFIAHDALLTVWGNFKDAGDNSKLQYDVASNVDGFSTRAMLGASREVNHCMSHLYELWLDNNCHWYALNNFANSEFDCKFRMIFPDFPQELNSLLVYGVSDLRGGNDCLYIFFSKYNKFQTKSSALDLLIPHIDHALSKIQHLENLEPVHKPRALINLSALTDRELEVIEWIKAGKTNQEIGVILNITQNTVKSHLKRVYQKLNVGKRAQAVALLVNH
jgi:transcriptional regulator EpsA